MSTLQQKRKWEGDDINGSNKRLAHVVAVAKVCEEIRSASALFAQPRNPAQNVAPALREVSLLFAELEELNRRTVNHTRDVKSSTSEAKQEMDRLNLRLQNSNYERLYLQREIAKCEDLETTYQDIKLVSKEQFLRNAPEELISATDEHQLMLNQLKYEMSERIALEQKEKILLARKEKLLQENKKKKEDMDAMEKELETFIMGSMPLQKRMHISITQDRKDAEITALLPSLLFALHRAVLQCSRAHENVIAVEIVGDKSQAAAWLDSERKKAAEAARTQASAPSSNTQPAGSSQPTDMDVDADPSEHQNRTTRATGSDKTRYDKHPMSVVVTIRHTDAKPLAKITFFYLPALNVVTTTVELPQKFSHIQSAALLAGLYPNDNGLQAPNETDNPDTFDANLAAGHAYQWVSELCEMGSNGEDTEVAVLHNVELIRQRYHALRVADAHIEAVRVGKWDKARVADGVVKGKVMGIKISDFNPIAGDTHELVVQSSGYNYRVEFTMPISYPHTAPAFEIKKEFAVGAKEPKDEEHSFKVPSHVPEIEKQVSDMKELPPSADRRTQLLVAQVVKLMACLEEYGKAAALKEEDEEGREKIFALYATL
ncbi:hypothetical protein HK097_007431 [Rhizophlyctis rosea]|uniref:THO complex subunit 5 n=1 Tax=Rhizophlyctis rosea TaxID=64517 RepID=A0AAD5SEQ9_9FUNG|nr:hypothetical protein HK097_007431 [Rhizophlyctis rosea]